MMAKSEFDDLVSSPAEDCNCDCHNAVGCNSSTNPTSCVHCKPAVIDKGDSTSMDWSRTQK